jgi:hypothetical protein
MMQRYRFVGSYTEMGERLFNRFGQVADWDEEVYARLVEGAPFIPDADFKRLPITQDELDRYADYANRALAPDSFNQKVKQAVIILTDIREKLASRNVHEELPTVEEPPEAPTHDILVESKVEEPEKIVFTEQEPEQNEHEPVVELDSTEHAVVPAPVEVQHEIREV